MLGAFSAIFAIIFFVMAHEAGHFAAAKATKMKATEFFFGFGPKLWSVRKGETEYGVKLIPLGGYVRIVGMNPLEEVSPADFGRTYREKPFWAKSIVVLAGVGVNFLIAYLIFAGVLLSGGIREITTKVATVVSAFETGAPTPAAEAGLIEGDVIVAIAGEPTPDWDSVAGALSLHPGDTVTISVDRNGNRLDLEANLATRTDPETNETRGFLGVSPSFENRRVGLWEAAGLGGRQVAQTVAITFQIFGRIVQPDSLMRLGLAVIGRGDVPQDIRPVSPIGIGQIGAQVDEIGLLSFMVLLGSISVILATTNVLPLYPLDGGHFAVAVYEKITGRQADVRKLAPIAVAVILLVGFLGVSGLVLDIISPIDI
jgi:membrane-associated protease RseP (regulator of RpoE activity)